MTARAELSSVSTGLDELLGRITDITEGLPGLEKSLVGPDLYDVERSLRSAQRRLRRLLDTYWS